MAFDGARVSQTAILPSPIAGEAWRRSERLALLLGVSALGAAAGFAGTLASGRFDLWVLAVIAAPVLALTLYLTGATLTEALERRAHGCAGACMLHVAAILAWPLTALFTPLSAAIFWIAPLAALSALVLFASCWSGAPRAIYRMAGQGALVAALAAHQGVFVILG
ncbi:MAG: hypothetical protein KF700_10985 [Hyphomonadaceae bacterium]|nr:hypothetical protein [Hyphomonadaceae bacterium]